LERGEEEKTKRGAWEVIKETLRNAKEPKRRW